MEQEEQLNNMLAGFHIRKNDENGLILNTNKMYIWFIPKKLRSKNIREGDIVSVLSKRTRSKRTLILVMNVYYQKLEEHEKKNKPVLRIVERAPERVH